MADVKYIITADAKGAVTSIKKVEGSIKGMKDQAKPAKNALKGMFGQFAAGLGATIAIGTAVRALTGFLKDSIEKAKEQELAEKGLTDALASTGREVPINAEHFKEYATQLQAATLYGDEQILSAQALLIQLTDLDKEGLDRATKGSLGLATVFKTDLKAATNLVAKALAGNYGALSRYGISVKDLNTDEEKRASLLDQLGTLYERAKGETDTYEGVVTQLKNTYGDFKEKIGDVVIKSEELRESVSLIQLTMSNFIESGAMDAWASKFDLILKNVPIFKQLKQSLMMLNMEMEIEIAKQKAATKSGKEWYEFIKDTNKELKIFGVNIYGAAKELIAFDSEAKTGKVEVELLTTEVHKFLSNMHNLKGVMENAQGALKNFPEEVLPPARDMNSVLGQTPDKFDDIEFAAETTTGSVTSLWDQMADGLQTKWASSIGEMLRGAKSFKDGLKGIWDAVLTQFTDIIGQMVAKWTTDLIGGLLSSSKKASGDIASAAAGAAGAAGGIGGAASGAAKLAGAVGGSTPWGAIAMGAGALLGGLLGGGGAKGVQESSERQLRLIWANSQVLVNLAYNEAAFVADVWKNQLDKMHMTVDELQKTKEALYGLRRDHKAYFGDMVSAQAGADFTSRGSGLMKYHPGERVTVQPQFNPSFQFHNQIAVIEKPTQWVIQIVQENLDRGNLRVPPQVVK